VVLNSCAKINLYLKVLNKRKNGYHNIHTVFERINLCDKITLKHLPDNFIKVTSSDPSVPHGPANLCYKSAKLLQDRYAVKKGVHIHIDKRIPIAAGLGGGSSNAASALLGLNRLWRLRLSREQLVKLAREIGSDVSFFLFNSPFAQGRGLPDRIKAIRSLNKSRLWHILIIPGVKVPTPLIYKQWDLQKKHKRPMLTMRRSPVKILTSALGKNDRGLIAKALFNDLESISIGLYPQIAAVKKWLTGRSVAALMSGSGSAVFGIVESKKEALSLYEQLRAKKRAWQVFVARTA